MQKRTMNVGWIGKTLNKFQFEQEPLPPVIRIFVDIRRPGNDSPNRKGKLINSQAAQQNRKFELKL